MIESPKNRLSCLIGASLLLALLPLRAEPPTRIPIRVNRPANLTTPSWPVTLGVPFAAGDCGDPTQLSLIDSEGNTVPAQIDKVADWPDGSLRWAHVDFSADFSKEYFLAVRDQPVSTGAQEDDILLFERGAGLSVVTGKAMYRLSDRCVGLEALSLGVDAGGGLTENEVLSADAAGAFYVVDNQGRRGVLKDGKIRVEQKGKRHLVIRAEGAYLTTEGESLAAAVVYFHFYAGFPHVRISHKFIVTQNTNDLWFRDLGLELPIVTRGKSEASLNHVHDRPGEVFRRPLEPDQELVMLQDDFPHFGSMGSHFSIFEEKDGKRTELGTGGACGDWAAVSSEGGGLAVQVPAFAEQFPKAFRLSPRTLTVKLWAQESGKQLDFRTRQIVRNYIGHDWIPDDHEILKLPNTAHGTSKTHEIWLYPFAASESKGLPERMGASRREIYAYADPQWTARTRIFGPISPRDSGKFPETEAAVSDYFDRSVTVGEKVFPTNGYLYHGMYPWGAQPWKQRPDQGNRWYPTVHRLSRSMDYDMRRSVWQLYARSGERKYYDYARRYTRLLNNLIFSSTDTPIKPLGWFVQGSWHSPLVWGHFGDGKVADDYKPEAYNTDVTLTLASSADLVQFVYDYFLTGDLHSRDMARLWKEAMVKEMDFDVDRALAFFRPDCFIRMLSAAYELDHAPRLLEYGRKIVRRIIPEKGPDIFRPMSESGARINYGKAGEIFSAFYYYYVATGDPLIREAFARLARATYRQDRFDRFFSRGSPLLQAFALAHEETGEEIYAAYLAQVASSFGRSWTTLEAQAIELGKLDQRTNSEIGRLSLVAQAPINVGLPVAMATASAYGGPKPYLPYAVKSHPTQRTHLFLKKEAPGAAVLDVYVNNWGHTEYAPRLLDPSGKALALEVLEREFKHVTEPECYDQNSFWVHRYADHLFLKLRIPESVGPGIYELDLGDEVSFKLLNSGIRKVLQVAPDGLVIRNGQRDYFPVPAGAGKVEYFAHRPVQVYSPGGQAVPSGSLGNGRYHFAAGGEAGTWSMLTLDDEYTSGVRATDTFFKIETVSTDKGTEWHPTVIALGDADRLFELDLSQFRPGTLRTPDIGEFDRASPFSNHSVRGELGKALHVQHACVEVSVGDALVGGEDAGPPVEDPLPREQGTVEFWFRPLWSATDCDMKHSTQRAQLYKADPIAISYWVDPDNGGRTGRYNLVKLVAEIAGAGNTQAKVYFHRGKWYHLAVTWHIDGKKNSANIFINGRKKAYSHYRPGVKVEAIPSALPPAVSSVRLGIGDWYGRRLTSGLFDELRISRSIRYTKHFAAQPLRFEPDADTSLLMHFDGSLDAIDSEGQFAGKLRAGRLW